MDDANKKKYIMDNGFHSRLVEQMFLKCHEWAAHAVGSCVHAADSLLNVSSHMTGAGGRVQTPLVCSQLTVIGGSTDPASVFKTAAS